MRHHKAQIRFQPFEFVLVTYGDFVDKTVLSVHDFVVRKRQYIIFAVCVRQCERQFVVHFLPEKRIGLDIRQGIVHPTHIPLEIEAQPADVGRHRYHRIRRAFFRNRENPLCAESNATFIFCKTLSLRDCNFRRICLAAIPRPFCNNRDKAYSRRRPHGFRRYDNSLPRSWRRISGNF